MRISVHVSKELQATLQRIRELPTETRKQIRKATKADALPIWQRSVGEHVESRVEGLVLGRTARVAVSDRGVMLQSARVGKQLSGGLSIKQQWHAIEFGGDRDAKRAYEARSRKGTGYTIRRHTQRQLRPRKATGHVVFPAISEAVPAFVSLWMQTVMRAGHEALHGKG